MNWIQFPCEKVEEKVHVLLASDSGLLSQCSLTPGLLLAELLPNPTIVYYTYFTSDIKGIITCIIRLTTKIYVSHLFLCSFF